MQRMDSRIGLDFIVENPEYIRKLAAALDTNNVTVKKQIFELLSALCVYNEEGHARALDTLEHYKKIKGERYRLNIIVKELDQATVVEYQTAVVAFINCLIISTRRLTDRTRLRNEFIGCHLLPVLNNLRKCAEAEPELAVQLDVFDEQRDSDDAQSLQGPHGVDLNSPLDVFYAILKQVAETPQEIPFLSILQHLLRIDPKEAVSDIIWDTAERLVHRATLLENRDDAARLLRTPSVQSKMFCFCQQHNNNQASPSRKPSLITSPLSPQPGPPPPPPPIGLSAPPPPPPPNINVHNVSSLVPMPPPPMQKLTSQHTSQIETENVLEKLPQQEIPAPKIKMKTINWNKIPSNKVLGKNNIWTQVAFSHQHSPMADMDWSEMEGLFCQQMPSSAQSSPKLGNRDTSDTLERKIRKENPEITLLDGKRSLNVNIFLKQFRSSNEDIIQLINDGEHDDIGAEKLKGLLKILPEVDELDMLKSFNGDFNKLGNAEKFLLQLTSLSNYKLRIESMLLKEEFTSNMGYLQPSINSMIVAAEDLMTNKPLQEVLYMILVAGNFLNSGGYAGNAAGVKLTSLQKITDIRANKPNMNLIHFVAIQAEKRNFKLLSFTDNIGVLEDAAKTTVEQLQNEINTLEARIKIIKKLIELPTTEIEIKHQMLEFLQVAEREMISLQRDMVQLENVRRQLADFFCEDINSFKLEECFRIFHSFYCKFKQAVAENNRRRIQEEQANARRRQREELLAAKRRQMGNVATTPDSDSSLYIDTHIYDPRTGFPMKKGRKTQTTGGVTSEEDISIGGSPSLSRKRLGSFNGQSGDNNTGKDEKSPDITPNGSLRRRRSRVLSEEDEGNLMDFLRASGHDSSRERKSWGSLDRSWARRARGSGTRKRPALLNADFSTDRERPSSPSPLAESKSLVATSEDENKPKVWRQKIESWLQASEQDQVAEDRRPTRRLINRRSFEMDSESERSSTLDTLPEGKQVQSSQGRVSEWKPSNTIDNTDVVSTMEAVEEANNHVKDKSAWRKSTLNVPNTTEATKDYRHTIRNYDDLEHRKELISSLGERPPTDKLTIYIRKQNEERRNKVEIDQDNIETPPTVRRVITPTPTEKREPVQPTPCKRFLTRGKDLASPDGNENNTSLGDGQFDRFSATRRTRRYKRNTETCESPESIVAEAQPIKTVQSQVEISTPLLHENPESRLKAWQERLKTQNETETKLSLRRNRNQTGINRDDLKKALHINTTSQPIDIVRSEGSTRKTKEDNDEGFEETQSLMSESPSQGASSGGGNYETDLTDNVNHNNNHHDDELNNKQHDIKKELTKSEVNPKLITKNKNFERNGMTRQTMHLPSSKKSIIPRRSGSLRKTDSQSSVATVNSNNSNKRSVQRSSSRNSILSSRSSLNSSASTNTVKKIPQSNTNKTSQQHQQQTTTNLKTGKLPLRRSSSSSSNIPNKRPPRPNTTATTSVGSNSSSFMKPTASSTTKIIQNNINTSSTNNNNNHNTSRLHQPSYSYRSKN